MSNFKNWACVGSATLSVVAEISDADKAILWRAGRLSWKLHAGQKAFYDHYRAWAAAELFRRENGLELVVGDHPNVYFLDAARRFGKDYVSAVIAIEDAIRRPGAILSYGTALAKDIHEIVIPLVDLVIQDCPAHLRPTYKNAYQGSGTPAYWFPNKSVIKLIGLERNPDSLRGRWSDGVFLSEGSFIDRLDYTISSVILHMFQLRPHANILINSTPPIDPGADIDAIYWPDCIERKAYWKATIYDNPRLTEANIREEFRRQGGPESPKARRELMCERVRFADKVVLPEFDRKKHVAEFELPKYGYAYTILDPGFRDLAGILCLIHDFERGKILVAGEWAKTAANTVEIAAAMKALEAESYGKLQYWDGKAMRPNPYLRYSDTELRLVADLSTQHGLQVSTVDKTGAEAALAALRTAFQNDMLLIHPRCKQTIEQCEKLIWNKSHTSYERSERLGHGDLVDCLKYGFRHVNRQRNPLPTKGWEMTQQNGGTEGLWVRPHHLVSPRNNKVLDALASVLPRGFGKRRR